MTTTTSATDGGGETVVSPKNMVKGTTAAGDVGTTSVGFGRPTLLMDVAIRCTAISCSCDCFSPCKTQIRVCDGCGHGWVSHALDKLGFRHLFNCHQVEVVQPSIAFDVASLMLYGTQAIPVRLKILLDRLFSVLQHEEVLQVLHGFGWTYEDYARGYIIQDPSGVVLDRWLLASREEEPLILQQFLRFGETKTIAQQLLLQESSERADFVIQAPRTESDIKKFIERTNKNSVGSSLFKQHTNHIYSHMGCSMPSLSLLGSRQPSSFRHPASSVSSRQSVSPTVSSPTNCTSPIALSPLNKLQNMQPYDFRQEKSSPELPKNEHQERQVSYGITSPTTSVPHISFTTSSLTNVSSTNNSSTTYTTASSERSGNEDGVYCSDGEDADEVDTAINLTRSSITTSYMDSVYAAKKVKHLRKSANPMKRRWNPTVLATLSTNPATGKKRVQCHVCLKTFCDKGALKIHFSAVHLREMHKCTVEGCNMMFSSRRSRNRHSANPNPKLHTPNYRRKINPHDGRAANPYPLMPPSGLLDYTNGMVSYSSGPHDGDSSSESEDEHRSVTPRMNCVTPEVRNEIITPPKEMRGRSSLSEDDVPLPLTKKIRMGQDTEYHKNTNTCDVAGIDLSMKDDRRSVENHSSEVKVLRGTGSETSLVPFRLSANSDETVKHESNDNSKTNTQPKDLSKVNSENSIKTENLSNNLDTKFHTVEKDRLPPSTKGVRKRKSLNPIKCPTASDDDLQFVSSDDSSSDTYIDQDNDENGMLDSKSDFLTSDASDSLDDIDDNNSDSGKDKIPELKISRKSLTPPIVATSGIQTPTSKNCSEKDYHTPEKYNGFSISDLSKFHQEISSNKGKDSEDICENPLRHLESLSLGAFNNMLSMNSRTPNFSHRGVSVSSGVSYHAPGLGLASVTTTTAPHRVESPPMEMMPSLVNNSSHPPPPLSSNCHLSNNSDTENSMSDQQMGMVPVYRDASMVGSLEIPVDKENPRRCTACGKIFQNHFGVKTHYQNVHLKLMHKCTVEGCNAAFPSKRSRDRHSANLNLHRKLLSTSSDRSSSGYFDKSGAMYPFHADAYRGDLFTRLYDHNSLPLSFADIYHNRLSVEGAGSPFLGGSPFAHLPGATPGFHPAFLPPTLSNFKNENHSRYHHDQNSGRNSTVSSISDPSSPSAKGSPRQGSDAPSPSVKLEEDLLPDPEGRFSCTICEKKFHEGVVLREHYEKSHTQALLQCSMNGCNKVFLSRQSQNDHSDSLHKEKCVEAT